MKRIIVTLILASIAIFLVAADSVALLSASKGKVDLSRDAKAIKFKTGDLLKNNDQLRTGGESFAAYKYIDGSSTIKVFSNSVVTITANRSGKTLSKKVVVNKGSIFTDVKPKTGAFMVQTPTTVASVKGTGFLTKITDDGQSLFIVTDGVVELKILDGEDVKSVAAGKTAVIDGTGKYEIRDSSPEDTSAIEQAEIESSQSNEPKIIRIPVVDAAGKTKYIEIKY
ncbi:MAG: FecR family protein [Candidatus Cloacimonetes bacterium]|nr:FecR domain-containing protein [Candidatus Cloacimonadota bacterium]MDD3235792.1 FecR family protein [Candidatus Cloacimonadota bacterium]